MKRGWEDNLREGGAMVAVVEGRKKRKQTKRRTCLRLSAERLPWDGKVVRGTKWVRTKLHS